MFAKFIISMPKLKPPEVEVSEEEKTLDPLPSHPIWSSSIGLGLVIVTILYQ
jgi:hypothetical protein